MLSTRKNKEINWLKTKISRLAYGEKTEKGIRPNISKKKLIKNNKISIRRLPNNKILEHTDNKKTLYYYGNGKTRDEETLVMIDIDVQKKQNIGSTKGAYDFLNHIKNYFPKLFVEPSTNNKGIHAYFILKKLDIPAKRVNQTLKGFENWLKNEAEKTKSDIETVEIKGLCPEIIYTRNIISNVKYGTLAKIPRNLENIHKKDNQYLSIDDIEKFYSIKFNKKNKNKGSISDKLFSEKDLKNIDAYKKIFNKLTDNCKLKARNHVVTDEDFAIALLILIFIYNNPNSDDTIPTERVKQLWISLFTYHDINRNWNHHRWKTIRDFLSLNKFIDWKDNTYSFGNKNIKGISCKWKLKEKFVLYVLSETNRVSETHKRASLMDTIPIITKKIKEEGAYLVPILKIFYIKDYINRSIMKIYDKMGLLCTT